MIAPSCKGIWYLQHSGLTLSAIGLEELSKSEHRKLVLERHTRPELVVVFNQRLQYRLAKRINEKQCIILTSRKEQYHGSQGKSRRIVLGHGPVPSDEGTT